MKKNRFSSKFSRGDELGVVHQSIHTKIFIKNYFDNIEYYPYLCIMKEIIKNNNETYTIRMDGWSVTANVGQLEEAFNKCFNQSIVEYIKKIG